jgi:hypothetical protein
MISVAKKVMPAFLNNRVLFSLNNKAIKKTRVNNRPINPTINFNMPVANKIILV